MTDARCAGPAAPLLPDTGLDRLRRPGRHRDPSVRVEQHAGGPPAAAHDRAPVDGAARGPQGGSARRARVAAAFDPTGVSQRPGQLGPARFNVIVTSGATNTFQLLGPFTPTSTDATLAPGMLDLSPGQSEMVDTDLVNVAAAGSSLDVQVGTVPGLTIDPSMTSIPLDTTGRGHLTLTISR
jgi:hypothetical protein